MELFDFVRSVRRLQKRARRLEVQSEHLHEEIQLMLDELSRLHAFATALLQWLEQSGQSELVSRLLAAVNDVPTVASTTSPKSAPLAVVRETNAPSPAKPAPKSAAPARDSHRVIDEMRIVDHLDRSARLEVPGKRAGSWDAVHIPPAAAELLRLLVAGDGRAHADGCVSPQPKSLLKLKLLTPRGAPLSDGALRQRVNVLRAAFVDYLRFPPSVLSRVRMGTETGYRLAYRRKA